MNPLQLIDQVLSYGLVLMMLLGYFILGYAVDAPPLFSFVMGAWLSVYAAARWWLFVSPQAKHRLREPWRVLYELKLMIFSAMAFFISGWGGMAAAFVAGILVHITLVLAIHKQGYR